MKWGSDDLVDKLISDNTARPRPGMDKPDAATVTLIGGVPKTRATSTAPRPKADSDLVLGPAPEADPKPNTTTDLPGSSRA